MGLFSRKGDAEGLYTGDAPASVPGMDGAAPSAYQAPRSRPAATTQPAPPPYQPPTYQQPGHQQPTYQPPPGYQSTPPGYQSPAAKIRTYRAVVGRPATPNTFRWIGPVIGLVVLVGVGVGVFGAFTASQQGTDSAEAPVTAVSGALGSPLPVGYHDADFTVTVDRAVAQPVDGWSRGNAQPDPKLVVTMDVKRLATGSGTVTMMPWDWTFTPSEGPAVDGELITGYPPELDGTPLAPGASTRAKVVFDTGSDTGTLALEDPYRSNAVVASWDVTAVAPKAVTGVIGRAAVGEIGAPQFTMTLAKPEWIPAGDDRLRSVKIGPAGSGTALSLTFTVAGVRKDDYAGQVQAIDIWFTPKGGKAVRADYPGPLRDATVLVSVAGTQPQKLVVGFTAKKQAGTVELRDAVGHTVIRWQI